MMRMTADKMIQTKGPFDLNMSTSLIAFACCLQTVFALRPGRGRRHRRGGVCRQALVAESIIRRAAALARDHTGADGVFRRARAPKERARGGRDDAAEHVAAAAAGGLARGLDGDGEAPRRVKAGEGVADGEAGVRQAPEAAPCGVAGLNAGDVSFAAAVGCPCRARRGDRRSRWRGYRCRRARPSGRCPRARPDQFGKSRATPGMPNSSTKNRYGARPVMVETWPGRIKPSMAVSGSSAMARSAAGVVLWTQKTEKLVSPCASASRMLAAMAGAVVSNPTPIKMTSRSGVAAASATASRGE